MPRSNARRRAPRKPPPNNAPLDGKFAAVRCPDGLVVVFQVPAGRTPRTGDQIRAAGAPLAYRRPGRSWAWWATNKRVEHANHVQQFKALRPRGVTWTVGTTGRVPWEIRADLAARQVEMFAPPPRKTA
jgi:hypothetical protein